MMYDVGIVEEMYRKAQEKKNERKWDQLTPDDFSDAMDRDVLPLVKFICEYNPWCLAIPDYVCVYTCVHVYVCACIRVCMCVFVCVCMCVCVLWCVCILGFILRFILMDVCVFINGNTRTARVISHSSRSCVWQYAHIQVSRHELEEQIYGLCVIFT